MKIIDYLKTNVNELLNSEKITFQLGGKSFTYTVREPSAGHELGILHYGNAQKEKDAAAYMIGACVYDENGNHIFDYQSEKDRKDFIDNCPDWLFAKVAETVKRLNTHIPDAETTKN